MKRIAKVLTTILAGTVIFGGCSSKQSSQGQCDNCCNGSVLTEPSKADATIKTYSCPMHSEIQSKDPGDCSLCGMKLVAK